MAERVRPATAASASRRERRVREVRDRILEAAMQRFAEQGIESTKIDEICALADVAQKTFFNHFPTKQHIVREIAAGFLNDLLAILDEACRAPGTTPQRLERFFMLVAADVERASPIHRHLVMEVVRLVHDDRTNVEESRRLYAAFGALLRDGVRAGDVTSAYPVAVLSEVVVGTFNTLMLNWLGFDDYPFRARATAMARFLTDGLRGRKAGVVSAKSKSRRR